METPSRLEPCLLDEAPATLLDLVAELAAASSALGARLHPSSARGLADAVRIMNCYYSNLIEGHNTTPREIERALANEFAPNEARRNLQFEARAHIRVQRALDQLHDAKMLPEPASVSFIQWLHYEFYRDAPEAMLQVVGGDTRVKMVPGELRSAGAPELVVGRHLPPDSAAVASFMAHFAKRYQLEKMGRGQRIMAIAAAHHRLNYIHPFLDGNGRVSRLMSHAMGLYADIGGRGLWSVSRGLARGLESRDDYKRMMDHADMPRQGDLDGRGNLSRRALIEFTDWFLRVCLDQIAFMAGLFGLDQLTGQLKLYVAQRGLKPQAFALLDQVLQRGEVARGDAPLITGLKERSARDLLSSLIEDGILGSETPKGPVSLRFPLDAIEILFPRLFPQT